MTGWRRLTVVLLMAGCAKGSGGGAKEVAPAPGTPAPPPAPPPAPLLAPPAERRPPSGTVRYGPSAMRYLVYRRLRIEQTFGGQPQRQDLGARVFVSAVITGPADSVGYPATFRVDSVLADSGTPQPIADNMSKVRALILAGRVAPRGDFQGSTASDSMGAQSIAQVVGNFRDFLPRIPALGARSGAAWSDTLSVTQRSGGGAVSRRATVQSRATGWEDHAGTRSLRIESNATYSLTGSGENGGQSFQVTGTGTTTSQAFVAEDGRYLGGESQDSTRLTVTLPAQGLTIPVTQVLLSSVVVQP
jgi:hypothetical protein